MILFIIIAFFIFLVILGGKQNQDFEKKNNFKATYLIPAGTYVSGHPQLNDSFQNAKLYLTLKEVKIYQLLTEVTVIPKYLITNVIMEDASTIRNRVTVGRLLLTGVFAFAWKKKTKQECSYLIIEWKQGNFDNETIFEFEGKGAINSANTLRNKFISYLSEKDNVNEIPKISAINNSNESLDINIDPTNKEKYLDLIFSDRQAEAVNFFKYNNKCTIKVAMEQIEKLKNETNLQK